VDFTLLISEQKIENISIFMIFITEYIEVYSHESNNVHLHKSTVPGGSQTRKPLGSKLDC
jgi:hypothetical protein